MKNRGLCIDCVSYIEYDNNSGWCTKCNNITLSTNNCENTEMTKKKVIDKYEMCIYPRIL